MATPGNNELSRLGEIPTLRVDLPAVIHETPEDEAAVAIHEVALDPQYLDVSSAPTRTVRLRADAVLTIPVLPAPDVVEIPPLPVVADTYVRGTGSPSVVRRVVSKATFQDSYRAKIDAALDARITAALDHSTAFVPVLSRKGGVGTTTITALLGMALASVRADRVFAVDAHPDRGTLADRVTRQTRATVDDIVARSRSLATYADVQALVSTDESGLDVLASSVDPESGRDLSEGELGVVTELAERFYSIVLEDTSTSIGSPLMRAMLRDATSLVIVSGGGPDDARVASETISWLEARGFADLAARSIVVVNTGTLGTDLDVLEQVESHFEARVRAVARIPYDPVLAAGGPIHFPILKPLTRDAARELAALVVDGFAPRED